MLEPVTWFKNSAFRWRGDGLTLYIDPWGITDPAPADVVFVTHAHFDHFVPEDIEKVRTDRTKIVGPRDVAKALSPGLAVPMHYGFVAGSPADGPAFREAASPVPVEVLEPTNPFERT